jgi:precorrin-6B methylase 2
MTKIIFPTKFYHRSTVSTRVPLDFYKENEYPAMKLRLFRALSYYFPITRKIPSVHSGLLELKFVDGDIVLDSCHASHSYGTVQKVLEFALQKIRLSSIENVLLLGLGGGSVIKSLRGKFGFRGKITAVEVDPLMVRIAQKEFGIGRDKGTQIACCEASAYVSKETKTFDLVIVDLFIDDSVAKEILSEEFWYTLKDRVSPNGYIIFNSMHERYSVALSIMSKLKKWGFSVKECNHVESYNTVLIAKSDMTWFG